ncbi:TetR/AcrR family transcriptional regulator [Nonomuraea sp. NPDC049129]|uniref:TetR/AcrR family transcriptional regulator n=1 Tax=Nonomuraea sp. NPDC049129 TaxID=3155272 RepID=UPI0033FE7CA3
MKTRPYHHGDLRAALLTRAEQTLAAKGPGALSLRELAREAGVSPAAPSRHFTSKQALLDALALEGHERLATAMSGALERADDSFADRLAAIAGAYVGFATANAALLDLMYSVKHDTAASEQLIAAKQRLETLTMELIEHGQRRGEVRAGPVDRVSLPVTATLQGFGTVAVSGAIPAEQIERSLGDTIAFILRGNAPSAVDAPSGSTAE